MFGPINLNGLNKTQANSNCILILPHDRVNFFAELQQVVYLVRPLQRFVVWRQLIDQFLSLRHQQVDPLQGGVQVLLGGHPPIAGEDDERVRAGRQGVHVNCRVAAVANVKMIFFLDKKNLTMKQWMEHKHTWWLCFIYYSGIWLTR